MYNIFFFDIIDIIYILYIVTNLTISKKLKMPYIHPEIYDQIEDLKKDWKLQEALKLVNSILVSDPENTDALMEVSDIHYRSGQIKKANKPIDFLLANGKEEDPIVLYCKGILEMEKTERIQARKYLRKAVEVTKFENPETIRALWMSEYWFGNREKWLDLVEDAYSMSKFDAEIIYNLTQIYTLQHNYKSANKTINFYYKNKEKLIYIDKQSAFYDRKIKIFEDFINTKSAK